MTSPNSEYPQGLKPHLNSPRFIKMSDTAKRYIKYIFFLWDYTQAFKRKKMSLSLQIVVPKTLTIEKWLKIRYYKNIKLFSFMKSEREPSQPNFELRKALVARISSNTLVKHGDTTLRNVLPNNAYFPHFLNGENIETGERVTIRLDDNQLPIVLEGQKDEYSVLQPKAKKLEPSVISYQATPPEPSEDLLNRNLREMVEATGDPFLGILTKIHTKDGMSSQLILRYGAKKRGEIKELLAGEKDYEEARHALHIFYQTRNFCDLPSDLREQALKDMLNFKSIVNAKERQTVAEKHPIFGLKPKAVEK